MVYFDKNATLVIQSRKLPRLCFDSNLQPKQAQAAEILMVSRPRVSDVVNMKVSKFTIDTLVNMLSRVGKPVRLAIG